MLFLSCCIVREQLLLLTNDSPRAVWFNSNYAVGIVDQQNFSIISSAHGLFWIEIIVNYYEIPNGSMCLRLKKNKVE
jgi:hypothetical protein